jgi:hypothetical protein
MIRVLVFPAAVKSYAPASLILFQTAHHSAGDFAPSIVPVPCHFRALTKIHLNAKIAEFSAFL